MRPDPDSTLFDVKDLIYTILSMPLQFPTVGEAGRAGRAAACPPAPSGCAASSRGPLPGRGVLSVCGGAAPGCVQGCGRALFALHLDTDAPADLSVMVHTVGRLPDGRPLAHVSYLDAEVQRRTARPGEPPAAQDRRCDGVGVGGLEAGRPAAAGPGCGACPRGTQLSRPFDGAEIRS